MLDVLKEIITFIGNTYNENKAIYNTIGSIISVMLFYKTFYVIIGFFTTRKFKKAKNYHKYAILIAARNEEKVIGNLLDSINKQDYPKELITTFVVADNCCDNTKDIAEKHGAIVYERFDNEHKTKGFALQYLCEKIEEDYKRDSYEGYFIFDADNLLKEDFISRMNDSFDAGCKIICSYRNTKNFDENFIASTYALHWLRSVRVNHRPRSVLHLATNIQGTGFLFSNEIIKNGWKYTSLTEDRALTADAVSNGYQISYNNDAIFYDEQPTSLKVALRQRLRWSRGHLEAFVETGPKLLANVFFGKLFLKNKWDNKDIDNKKWYQKLLESIRHRFASYDTLMQLTPFSVINFIRWVIVSVIIYSCYTYVNGISGTNLFRGGTYLAQLINSLFETITITAEPGFKAMILGAILEVWLRIFYRIGSYIENITTAIYIFIIERKRIIKIPFYKKVLYCLTWPTFDIIGRYTTYIAIFKKVTWKPIPHESKITIDDLKKVH